MFRTDLLSIIRSPDTVFIATGICHTGILKMGKITSVYIRTLSLNYHFKLFTRGADKSLARPDQKNS